MKFFFKILTTSVLSLLFSSTVGKGQNAATFDGQLVTRYYQLELQLIRTGSGFTPPVAARAIGYTGLALYESVVPGIPTYQSGEGIINGLSAGAISDPGAGPYHWPTVANNALGTIIDSLFGNASAPNKLLIQNLKDSFNLVFQGQISASVYDSSVVFGTKVAQDVFAFSTTDGGHQSYSTNFPAGYVLPVGPKEWIPTPPAFAPIPLQPYWGNVRPFVAANVTGTAIPPSHIAFDSVASSPFYLAAEEVRVTVNNATTEQTNIANFWADGGGTVTPPGHSISILTQIATSEGMNLEEATLAYSKLSLSQMDAFINCWKVKYIYNLIRPISYIKNYMEPGWNAIVATPPFPEYTSGHSTQSGAFKEVMTGIFGGSYSFTDQTHGGLFGGPRNFNSFEAAAQEAAVSRLYGGIHYKFSNDLGLELGSLIGKNINALYATQLRVSPVADAAIKVEINPKTSSLGQQIVAEITVINEGLTALSGIQVKSSLPAGMSFVSASASVGTYDSGTGIWDIPTIDAGTPTVSLTIIATISEEGVPYLGAEIIAMNETDADSSPNNQAVDEDDLNGGCTTIPITLCNPNLILEAPLGFSSYQWYLSTDEGANYTPFATGQQVTITQPGYYLFSVDNAVLGDCGNQLCCPVIVTPNCCPQKVCLPVTVVRQ